MTTCSGSGRPWFLQLFGGYRLKEGENTKPVAPQELFLMVLLAVAERPVSRSTLIGLMWDDYGERRLRHRLSQVCLSLRRRLAITQVIVSEGDTLSLNRALVRTDLDEVADDARKGNRDRIMARLDLGFYLPRAWLICDDRIPGWVLPEFRQHTQRWKRSFEQLRVPFPLAVDVEAEDEFGRAVVRSRAREPCTEATVPFYKMICSGIEAERRRGNASGIQLLLGVTKTAVMQLHPSSLEHDRFLALFSQRALWEEGTGGGADALAALRGYRARTGGRPDACDLYLLLPVLEVEGLLHSPPLTFEVEDSIRGSLKKARNRPAEALACARLVVYARSVGLGPLPESDGMEILETSGNIQDRQLLTEVQAHEAERRGDPAQAASLFRLLLKEAEAAWDYPAIAVATAGLLRLAPDPVPDFEVRRLLHRLPSPIQLPRRERSLLREARRHWTDGAGESTVSLSVPATPLLQLGTFTDAPTPPWTLQPPFRWMDRGHHRRHVFREIRRADATGAARHDRAKADPGIQISSGRSVSWRVSGELT